MKLKMVTGCTCDSLTVDGRESTDFDNDESKVVIDKVCDWLKSHSELQQLLKYVLDYHGEYESLGHCEQCGDFIDKYTLEI